MHKSTLVLTEFNVYYLYSFGFKYIAENILLSMFASGNMHILPVMPL